MSARAHPVPATIAALPHDPRGYPIPAITPRDTDGKPMFAVTGTARTLICAVERRCSICGSPMAPGPVWRVIDAAETAALASASAGGAQVANKTPSPEPPGHRECMLFAAFTCPFLARPNARRRVDVEVFGERLTRGTARGGAADGSAVGGQAAGEAAVGGAVAGFADYEFRYVPAPGEQVAFRYSGLVELRPHLLGADQIPGLVAVLGDQPAPTEACPDYLLDDEAAAERHAAEILRGAIERGEHP